MRSYTELTTLDAGLLPHIDALVHHRLAPLAFHHAAPTSTTWRAALRPHVLAASATDLVQSLALIELSNVATDLNVLVIKGAATGALLYGAGALRPRTDIDVWVDGWAAAHDLANRLVRAGYHRVHQLPGTVARHAIALRRRPAEQVDVHAVCSRRVRLSRALPFAHAWAARQDFTVDGQRLYTLSHAHAWLLGAVHLTAHHPGQQPPLVLVDDLRRLAQRCEAADWAEIWARASAHELVAAIARSATRLEGWAPGVLPPAFADEVAAAAPDASTYFDHPLTAALDDLELLRPMQAATYLRELTLPPARYLHHHFGIARPRPYWMLATHRLLSGLVAQVATRGHNRAA